MTYLELLGVLRAMSPTQLECEARVGAEGDRQYIVFMVLPGKQSPCMIVRPEENDER